MTTNNFGFMLSMFFYLVRIDILLYLIKLLFYNVYIEFLIINQLFLGSINTLIFINNLAIDIRDILVGIKAVKFVSLHFLCFV